MLAHLRGGQPVGLSPEEADGCCHIVQIVERRRGLAVVVQVTYPAIVVLLEQA